MGFLKGHNLGLDCLPQLVPPPNYWELSVIPFSNKMSLQCCPISSSFQKLGYMWKCRLEQPKLSGKENWKCAKWDPSSSSSSPWWSSSSSSRQMAERLIITMTMIKKKELIFRRGFDTFFGQLQLPHKVAKHIFCTVFTQSRILNTFLHIPLNIPFHMVMIKTQFDVCISFGKLSFSQAQEISFCFNKFQRNSRWVGKYKWKWNIGEKPCANTKSKKSSVEYK